MPSRFFNIIQILFKVTYRLHIKITKQMVKYFFPGWLLYAEKISGINIKLIHAFSSFTINENQDCLYQPERIEVRNF